MNALVSLTKRIGARRTRDERGAMLVIALIVITVVATVTGAILSHGWVNLRSTLALRAVAGTSYSGDAAAKIALNDLRLGSGPKGARSPDWIEPPTGVNGNWNDGSWNAWVYTNNADGTGCFGLDAAGAARPSLELKGFYPKSGDQAADSSARVECAPVPGTGILSGGKGVNIGDPNSTDPYAQALTTTGSSTACNGTNGSSCSGLYFKPLGTGDGGAKVAAPVGGGVTSNTGVMVDNGALTTDGFVHANGTCSGTIVSSDTQCHGGAATMPTSVGDILNSVPTPIYDSASVYPTKDALGNCHFTSGSYASGKALSTAVNACAIAYFASGKYYFDFQDTNTTDRVWNIGSTEIIGGEPTATTAIPGACKSPLGLDNGGKGVQFVFGGTSSITFGHNSKVELCGPSSSGAPLTISQQQGSGPSVTVTDTPTATTTPDATISAEAAGLVANRTPPLNGDAFGLAGTVPSGTSNSLTGALQAGDSFGAKWTSSGNNHTGEIDLSNFAGMDAIPANATIKSAALHVGFSTAPVNNTALSAIVSDGTNQAGNAVAVTATGDVNVAPQIQTLVNSGALNTTNRPTVQLKVTDSKNNNTFTLDQVTLTVTYNVTTTPPPTTTTVALEPWASTSAFISSGGGTTSQPAQFVVDGATYAPNGTVDIEDQTNDFIAFRWGLLAKGVSFKTYPAQSFGYPIVSIPAPGSSLGRTVTGVDLTVYVCVQQATCSSGGTKALTVRALITDPPYPDHPIVGLRQIKILSWAEQH